MPPEAAFTVNEAGAFAGALRRARLGRRLSQLDLALACDVSARHVSFLESGRAQPSRDMALKLAAALVLPLGARNALLQAAGFAPIFPASPLTSEALGPFRAVLGEMMARHDPNPALLCDRHWNVLDANVSARALLGALAGGGGEVNVVRLMTEDSPGAALIGNRAEVLAELSARIALEALEAGGDPAFDDLVRRLDAACARHPRPRAAAPRAPLTPILIDLPEGRLSFLSAIAQFGTSEDVTVRDLRLELLFPADEATRAAMAARA